MERGEKMAKKTLLPLLIFFTVGGWVFGSQYEFGKPSYDSGWLAFAPNEIKILTHNLGGNINDYVVDMQFLDNGANKVNQIYFGSRDADSVGTYWSNLTASTIRVDRCSSDVNCEEIRVRIWKIERANFDSGWKNISLGQTLDLTHNIGGSSDDYVVCLEFKDNEGYGVHQRIYGGSVFQPASSAPVSVGAYWRNLNSSTVRVTRGPEDTTADQIRLRIWKANHPDYDSGWQSPGAETSFHHNLGGPWNDYVVDLQFKDIDDHGVNQMFYGGGPSPNEAGAYWKALNGSQVSVVWQTAGHIDRVRVRIWRCSAPKYDSGWFNLSAGTSQTLTHGLGGNSDDYVVDLQFKDSLFGLNNRYYGGRMCYDGSPYTKYRGAYWYALNTSQITVYRSGDDAMAGQVRIRIWLAPSADFDSGWRTLSAPGSMDFNPGLSNEDDCVVYLEFKNNLGVNHMDYGGNWWWDSSDVLHMYGAYWSHLSPTNIRVTRQQNDTYMEQFRVRIWKNDPSPVPCYAWKSDWTWYEVALWNVVTHGLGGNIDDYVLDMRFQDTGLYLENHFFYGSMYGKQLKAGAFYQNLNSSSLEVVRELNDGVAASIMLRMWNTGYAAKTVYVSGHVSFAGNPLPDVAIAFSGTGGGTCYTDSNGNYFMSLTYDYSGTATPSRIGYVFTPTHRDYSSLVANATADYTAGAVPAISVTQPNGGETWAVGSSRNITWTSTGVSANVKIEYSANSGSSYTLITASTANDGTHPWTIPGPVSANCLVKVSDAASPSLFDVSDAAFFIVPFADKRISWTSGTSRNAAIAVEASGKIHVVWQDDTSGNYEIYHKKSPDGGLTWTTSKRLTFTSGLSGSPAIAVDASLNLHVVWQDDTSGNYEIYHKKSTDGGATWTASKRLSWTSGGSEVPAIGIGSSGKLHVVWSDDTPGNEEIYYTQSKDKGANWAANQRLTWTSGGSKIPAIGVDSSGNPHVVWRDDTPGNFELYYKSSPDGGATWATNKRLTWNSGTSNEPVIAVDASGHLHVVWTDDTPGNDEIFYKQSLDGGAAWAASKRLIWNSGSSHSPAMTVDSSDHLHVVYVDHTSGRIDLYYKKSMDGGANWTTGSRLTWTIGSKGSPALGVDSTGNLHLVWEEMTPGNYEIYYMKFK